MNFRKENGVTLMTLVVTIIVLSITLSITIKYSIDSIKESKDEAYIAEAKMVSQAVLEQYTKYIITNNEEMLIGRQLPYSEVENLVQEMNAVAQETNYKTITLKSFYYDIVSAKSEECYYQLSTSELSSLGITNAEYTFIINYKTGEVINKTIKNTSKGEPIYAYAVE